MEVSKIWAKLGRLYQFRKSNRSQKLTPPVEEILLPLNFSPRISTELDEVIDYLEQRLKVLSAWLHRCKRYTARGNDNRTFSVDDKRFYRKLADGQDDNYNASEPPRSEQMARYWSIIWDDHVLSYLDTMWLHLQKDTVSQLSIWWISYPSQLPTSLASWKELRTGKRPTVRQKSICGQINF